VAPGGTTTRDVIKSGVPVHAFSDVSADDVSRMCAGAASVGVGKSSISVVSPSAACLQQGAPLL